MSKLLLLWMIGGLLMMVTLTASGEAAEIIGHRGASQDAPENTLASVNLAWKRNADAVEIDVLLSRDGRIVVFHDETTKRIGGRNRKVARQTLAELRALDVGRWKDKIWTGEKIPTLDEVVATIPNGKRLFIEIKCGREIIPALKQVLKASGKKPKQTALIGFSLETMTAVKRELPAHQVYWVVGLKQNKVTKKWSPSVETLIQKGRQAKMDGLDLGKAPVIDREFVQKVKRSGLGFYMWTVNDPDDARRYISYGVEGITTDRPGWMRERVAKGSK